jgi:hypothetical protein
MNNDIADIISQMDDRDFYQFLGTDFKDLTGVEFLSQQLKNQSTPQLKARAIKAVQLAQEPEERKQSVISAYLKPEMKLSSQSQESRVANVDGYSKFADDSYTAGDNDYADFDTYDESASANRLQPNATKPQGVSQAPLDIAGVQNAIAQDPNWQPRNDYEKWVVGQLQGAEWTPNPTLIPANTNGNTVSPTPKAQDEKYQFNVLENRENRTANIRDIPIPKPVGIRSDLQTGLVYDYNQGLVYDPSTGVTQKILSKGLFPTPRTIPDVIQGEQSSFIPVPPIESRLDLDPNLDLSPQTRQYLVDRQWGKDKEQAYIQQQQLVDNQLTDGEGRFFGTASYSNKRDNSVPYKRSLGIASRVAGVGQEYSPEAVSRIGQGGFLNNAGSIILPNTWTGDDGNTVFSKGRGTATTIVYKGDKEGNAIPSISIPRVEGNGNELVSFEDAVKRQLISPEQYDNYINQASQTRFIPANNMDGFNRDNVKLYEATDNEGKNYRATYMNPQTKEVYNVAQNGGFYLVRPGVSEEASGLPTRKGTTNLAQEMTDINRAMREGGRDNLVDVIRENPDNPGLEAFTRPIPAINPITGETINKYVHTGNSGRWVDEDNPQELFNYFNANQESQGASMQALDLARGGNRTAGGKVTPAYPSLQETDYLAGRLAFNASGNIVDVPSQQLAAKGINNFTPASEFYSNSPQTIRDWRTGELLDTSNRSYGNDVLRFPINPETPLAAYKVNEFGTPIPNEYGFPVELPIQLPRSAQIGNKAEEVSQPRLMVQDFKGVTPDYQPIPDGMSYEEAERKGLLEPIFNARNVGLNSGYQIPLPKGVGLARVLDESDPRTQAAFAAQAEVKARIAADNTIVKPAFDRKYTITPNRTAGIESPQYAQYTDLTTSPSDDTARFWREDLDGIVPQGVIDGAYLPVTVTPRPVNAEGKKGWLINDQIYTTESGREVRGDKALNYVNVPLNLDGVATNYLPKGKREELELKGFDDAAIDAWVNANPNLARDNALANAKIKIDGQYYDVTPQATVAEFNPAAGGNYAMAETRSQGRAARIDLPFKAGTNISEPTPEWIEQQAASGNLRFNPDDYIRPDDIAILNQKEVYNAGYEEPTDILGAINRTQQRKNQVDAVISNANQRAMNNLNEQVGSIVNGEYITQDSTPDLEVLKAKSNYLADEINRARYAHNAIIGVEDAPEIVVTRRGNYNQLENFVDDARALGLEDYNITGDKQASMIGSLPNDLLPYEQAKELNQTGLLPAYRTQQKVKLPTVPTSNVANLGRVKFVEDFMGSPESMLGGMGFNGGFIEGDLIPNRIKATSQVVPAGNQVVDIVPSSSWQSTNPEVIDNPRIRRRNQTPGVANNVFSMGGNTPNIPIDSDVRMTGGMNIPKWAIPATLGAVWLGLAANARRQQDEERRQQQGVNVR